MKPDHPISAHRMKRILELLLDGDLSQKQIAEKLHITRPAGVKAYLKHLNGKRQIFIVRWTPRGVNGHTWPVFRYGKGRSAKPPPIKPMAQVHRAWRIRSGRQKPDAPNTIAADPFDTLRNV